MSFHRIAVFAFCLWISGAAGADGVAARLLYSDDTPLSLGAHAFEGGKMLSLTVGIGSGAFRHPSGIAGARTQIVVVRGAGIARTAP